MDAESVQRRPCRRPTASTRAWSRWPRHRGAGGRSATPDAHLDAPFRVVLCRFVVPPRARQGGSAAGTTSGRCEESTGSARRRRPTRRPRLMSAPGRLPVMSLNWPKRWSWHDANLIRQISIENYLDHLVADELRILRDAGARSRRSAYRASRTSLLGEMETKEKDANSAETATPGHDPGTRDPPRRSDFNLPHQSLEIGDAS